MTAACTARETRSWIVTSNASGSSWPGAGASARAPAAANVDELNGLIGEVLKRPRRSRLAQLRTTGAKLGHDEPSLMLRRQARHLQLGGPCSMKYRTSEKTHDLARIGRGMVTDAKTRPS